MPPDESAFDELQCEDLPFEQDYDYLMGLPDEQREEYSCCGALGRIAGEGDIPDPPSPHARETAPNPDDLWGSGRIEEFESGHCARCNAPLRRDGQEFRGKLYCWDCHIGYACAMGTGWGFPSTLAPACPACEDGQCERCADDGICACECQAGKRAQFQGFCYECGAALHGEGSILAADAEPETGYVSELLICPECWAARIE
jgi:hypothetical protein